MIAAYMEQQAYIPFTVAAEITGLPAVLLRKLVRDGVVEGEAPWRTKEVTGSCNIDQARDVAEQLAFARQQVAGKGIRASEASARYKFGRTSIYRWHNEGWIKAIGQDEQGNTLFDEGDIAFARALADMTGISRGKVLFPIVKHK